MGEAVACLSEARECLRLLDFDGAQPLLRRAIAIDPKLGLAYELLGKLLYRNSRPAEAAAVYRSWLAAMPSDPIAAHMVAATSATPPPKRASDGFVTGLFERAAPDFDSALANLGYRAPQLLLESAAEVLEPGAVALDILDLGCGTGLCGDWFRPLARQLVGVDLSPGMIAQAKRRGCYDELVCAEIAAFMEHSGVKFDVVTAADVFCYFGELTAPFAGVARVLRPGGWFIFSVEELTSARDCADVALLEHGRYAHTASHVLAALNAPGLHPSSARKVILRFERGEPVSGLIVAARLPS